jgi:esterase/lipase superfamily enzyme
MAVILRLELRLYSNGIEEDTMNRALERIALKMRDGEKPPFREILLTAPDIDVGVFTELADDFRRAGERVTLYASSNDRALKASKEVHGFRRAGDSAPEVLVIPGIDTIDVSTVDTSLLGHSYVGDNCSVLSDMQRLLRKREPPDRRASLQRKEKGPGLAYWMFSAAASSL